MLRVGLPYRQGQRQKSPLNFWLVGDAGPRDVKIVAESFEEGINFRMRYRVRIFLGDQILFGHVGDIGTLGIFRQQVVIRLLFARPVLDRDRLPPFFGICELRVDVENDAAERDARGA